MTQVYTDIFKQKKQFAFRRLKSRDESDKCNKERKIERNGTEKIEDSISKIDYIYGNECVKLHIGLINSEDKKQCNNHSYTLEELLNIESIPASTLNMDRKSTRRNGVHVEESKTFKNLLRDYMTIKSCLEIVG